MRRYGTLLNGAPLAPHVETIAHRDAWIGAPRSYLGEFFYESRRILVNQPLGEFFYESRRVLVNQPRRILLMALGEF